jgi:P4 family phage/plasmid primase-like protien
MAGHPQNPKTLESFLKKYRYNKDDENSGEITHTRIGDKKKIYGGSYSIPKELLPRFYELYYQEVFEKGTIEYLTEKQHPVEGPILVDFDFRYENTVKKRKHTENHIIDIIDLYLHKMKDLVNFNQEKSFPIYVFEKPDVNIIETENITKDGIHMIIGVSMTHKLQMVLRKKVLDEIADIWGDLPIINTWESVLDEGITMGYTNWQMIGSRKPHHQCYQVKIFYETSFDPEDGEFTYKNVDVKTMDMAANMAKMSAQCETHHKFTITEKAKEELKGLAFGKGAKSRKGGKPKSRKKLNIIEEMDIDFSNIGSMEELDAAIEMMLGRVEANDYYVKEAHDYVMILPKLYYERGSYDKWIRVGWALRNTDNRLFLTWIKMSAKSETFSFDEVGEYYDMWRRFASNKEGLTYKSIMYWAKNDADRTAYNKIRHETVDYFIEQTIRGQTEFDLANVLLQLFKDRFVCVSIKNNIWYEFKNHRWTEIDSGNTLRLWCSRDVHKLYCDKAAMEDERLVSLEEDDPQREKIKKKIDTLISIGLMLRRTNHKNNIMREARDLFYDKDFLEKQDENNNLMCFNNGVFDFRDNVFRDGKPEDYITKCTNIDYVPIHEIKKDVIEQVEEFMHQLFPVEELHNYMWDHLASTLIGTNENQTFNIYIGSGANGKSKLVDLMTKILGDYKGTVPITLITQKRPGIGGTSSEIVQLRGVRYAVMQEPSKGDKINEGIMKEITGGDPIQGRALFKETVTFVPQFKLVVCTNTLFDIKDTGDGTWRRIRVCDFKAKFRENPVQGDPDEPYQFPIDKKIEAKFEVWKEPFMSKLVEIAKKKKGLVEDCEIVLSKSNAYREDQDYLREFAREKIITADGGKIKKTELLETFKQWYTIQYGRSVPKGKELYDFIDKKYSKNNKGTWIGIAINYDQDDDEEDVDDI